MHQQGVLLPSYLARGSQFGHSESYPPRKFFGCPKSFSEFLCMGARCWEGLGRVMSTERVPNIRAKAKNPKRDHGFDHLPLK